MMANSTAIYFLVLLISSAFGGLIGSQKIDGARGKNDGQIVHLQQQLEKLQNDLLAIRNAKLKSGSNDNNAQEIIGEEISSLDRVPTPQRRGVGWQPLKRSGTNNPSLGLNDPKIMRQQMVEAIEDHLLQDLESSRQYGIEPQQILQNLRTKHDRDQD